MLYDDWWAMNGYGKRARTDKTRFYSQEWNLNIYCDCNEKSNFIGFFSVITANVRRRGNKKREPNIYTFLCVSPSIFVLWTLTASNHSHKKMFIRFICRIWCKTKDITFDSILDSICVFRNSFPHSSLLSFLFVFEFRIFFGIFYIPTKWNGSECW